ncbi:PVC-type heme-binding CxxCH protein [Pelagicoccus sp. SDUM812002]|uniref:PVC-type heme-binding CxxCH protein n=1 Tax=Pelagicoccus sp. SDUM812002 TaxID=3041266 RepID=UPI00280C9FBF|nr:PVC-type heme-binding CxxCH protein [Pelagicoccus sp. SDUM812002]MDQ8184643.1 GDSL-type esterase/lipase family protein [Pelagicoccus sp. SDUM812002]
MPRILATSLLAFALSLATFSLANGIDRLVFEPPASLDNGKRIVLVSGDEEYRSEESCPMLAKILSQRHGFHCTVLFAIDPANGYIDPNHTQNIPGLEALYDADLMILGTRWRRLPGEQLQPILDFLNSAKPIIAFRTATHAFNNENKYGGYDWQNFGKNVVGENWLNHHGKHKVEGGRAMVEAENAKHPILNSVGDIFTWSDIYGIAHLDQKAATVLLRGAVTETLEPDSKILNGPKNDPMMPLAWLKSYPTPSGDDKGLCFATTAGAAYDLQDVDLRRLFVNAAYDLLDLPVPAEANVDYIDPFDPSFYGFQDKGYFQKRKLLVSDYRIGHSARSILSPEELDTLEKQTPNPTSSIDVKKNARLVVLGNGLSERMLHHGHFETELHLRFPNSGLTVRNLSRSGSTPGFRPHPSRNSQWAFPGAAEFHPNLQHHSGEGHYPTEDEWLAGLEPDIILACYGYNESFNGPEGLESFRRELSAFVDHSLNTSYNASAPPQLALASPIAFQNLSDTHDLPNGKKENANLAIYTQAIKEVADERGIVFIDLFTPTKELFDSTSEPLTVNGAHLNDSGYRQLAPLLASLLFPESKRSPKLANRADDLTALVLEKDWYWFHDYKMPNGIHAYGRRFEPFGVENYPEEVEKVRQLTANRDLAIHALLQGQTFDLASADRSTRTLSEIKSNAPERANNSYRYGQDALDSFTLADGYQIELFASEKEFPNLANPAQLSFDNQGRLWVSVLPSYPHFRPGDPQPNDKLLIYEDTDGDGKADKETVFAENLHLPIGFELGPEGVYLSQAPNLVRLLDRDGDDHADHREILLSGFDTHDTHHAISAFTADPSGAIYMGEGVFLHSNVETAYGPIRSVNGGFYRFSPQRQKLERIVQTHTSNPWGIAHDQWGQEFFLSTSEPDMYWMLPVQVKPSYGQLIVGTESIVPDTHRVRPTSGLEFVSSRHFPEQVQGDYLLNNCIGFLGAKQHSISDSGAGYISDFRQDLFQSTDPNFRPVDLEFAPDGSLYVVDWHNQLIGHMQHNARDPLRDHAHGRIYRITHKNRPLVPNFNLTEASVTQLVESLSLPELRTRYRIRRELRGRPPEQVLPVLIDWIVNLDTNDPREGHHKLEALWTSWGLNQTNTDLLRELLNSDSHHIRSATVRVLRYNSHMLEDHADLLARAASDTHPRVRLEALIAASRLDIPESKSIVELAGSQPLDKWTRQAYSQALVNLGGTPEVKIENKEVTAPAHLTNTEQQRWEIGYEIYRREGHCITCHQEDGGGLPAASFPPIAGTEWTNGHPERLIDLTLHGLMGPIEVKGTNYAGHVPMTQFNGLLDDQEIAAVLTYVRNAFGNQASVVTPEQVAKVRASSQGKAGFWTAETLDKKYDIH